MDTGYIENHQQEIFRQRDADINYAAPFAGTAILTSRQQRALASANHSSEPNSPWHLTNSWGLPETTIGVKLQGQEINLAVDVLPDLTDISIIETRSGFDLFTPKGFFHCAEIQPDLGLVNDNIGGQSARANAWLCCDLAS